MRYLQKIFLKCPFCPLCPLYNATMDMYLLPKAGGFFNSWEVTAWPKLLYGSRHQRAARSADTMIVSKSGAA
nr:MAG TPA: hypothetical protein [Bacteriophage sp.]